MREIKEKAEALKTSAFFYLFKNLNHTLNNHKKI